MMASTANDPAADLALIRPPIGFRVGVTGTRAIAPAAEGLLERLIADVLSRVRTCCDAIASEPWTDALGPAMPGRRLVLLSSLAEGADRLVARAGLQAGFALTAVLPFTAEEYARDFPATVDEFGSLLGASGSQVLALDGAREGSDWRSYEAAGQVIVRNCDLLLAVWDDAVPPHGRGGTEDTIRFALTLGVPVLWIHSTGQRAPVILADLDNLPNPPVGDQDIAAELTTLIGRRLRPPFAANAGVSFATLREVAGAPAPRQSAVWSAHRLMTRWLSGGGPAAPPDSGEGRTFDEEGSWQHLYSVADERARGYAARYRSCYTYVILLAALALACAASALVEESQEWEAALRVTAAAEAACLLLILGFVYWSRRARWHERSIGYRLLAELYRKQATLAAVGWSLTEREVTRTSSPRVPECAWAAWTFSAAVRAAPLVAGTLSTPVVTALKARASRALVEGQAAYHRDRAQVSERVAGRLLRFAAVCFFTTLACVVMKLLVLQAEGPAWLLALLGWLATVLPALSAAGFALRSYAEYEVMSVQSERMAETVEDLGQAVAAVDPTRPLASQALGAVLDQLTSAMLADIVGWAQLFQVKVVEAG